MSGKTDQEAAGQTVLLPHGHRLRPVQALRDWIDRAQITEGVLFRRVSSGGQTAAGLPPASYAGHSLRAGFVTSSIEDGAARSGVYLRRLDAFRQHPGEGFL
jgi:hypothetical protein